MKRSAKLVVVVAFAALGVGFACSGGSSGVTTSVSQATPTPGSNTASNASTAAANTAGQPSGDKKIPKSFVLGKDSLSEYGEAAFDHDTHAFKPYSPDGKSVVACIECHHTDQPKSAMKPPLVTSERNETLTMEVYQKTSQKVSGCRDCHFQEGNVPEGKVMPTATYTDTGSPKTKNLNNELAYHINCNTCHDAAAKLRPEIKKKPGFATSKDCTICHKSN